MGKSQRNHKGAKGPTPQLRSRNTRSSKGRLLTDTSSSTTLLTSQLSLLGLYAAPTIGDGNCLFRALSDQLHGSPSKHYELRQQICDHIATHKARYEPFVEDERGLEGHLRAMREHATYGGHMELSAFAHMTKRNVKVIQPGLVYVIEWKAGESSGSGSGEASTSTSTAETVSGTPRRSRRMSTRSPGSPLKPMSKSEDGKEEIRVKVGKGYYVYEEVSSDEEEASVHHVKDEEPSMEESLRSDQEEGGGPTVYVAYHDWEHFSSIRNLRGPHTGLPTICETPPPPVEPPMTPMSAKDKEKERERERKKERERKEKERKERKLKEKQDNEKNVLLKLKLKLPTASSSSTSLSVPVTASTEIQDPALIPLPSSRSASPFIHQTGSSSSLIGPLSTSLPSSSLSSEVYPDDPSTLGAQPISVLGLGHPMHPHTIPQTPRSQYRSPKRSFDESSASGGEDAALAIREQRSRRRRVGSVADMGKDEVVNLGGVEGEDMEVDPDAGADTPGLSAPGSSSSSSSSNSSAVSEASSEGEGEADADRDASESSASPPSSGAAAVDPSTPTALVMPDGLGKKARQKYLHMHLHHAGGQKPLTRRQRKALGLPKVRDNAAAAAAGGSAGKIVIPGGKWKGPGNGTPQDAGPNAGVGVGVVEADADEEWRRNGTGRLDVRGFRELKI